MVKWYVLVHGDYSASIVKRQDPPTKESDPDDLYAWGPYPTKERAVEEARYREYRIRKLALTRYHPPKARRIPVRRYVRRRV